ncbi:unnamed protein product [Trichobilharzia regenti]|nr:unnamed protein product [Trichobilharzia regenti]
MKFASLQYNDEAYMTPRDFVKCFLSPAATDPQSGLEIAFRMFDLDSDGSVDLDEFKKSLRFISGLQSELLHYEFEQLNLNQGVMSPVDLGRSLLRYSNISADNAQKGLLKIQADRELMQKV